MLMVIPSPCGCQAGRFHDSQEAEALLEAMPVGATLLADKGYDSNAVREVAARKNAWANIPSPSNANSA